MQADREFSTPDRLFYNSDWNFSLTIEFAKKVNTGQKDKTVSTRKWQTSARRGDLAAKKTTLNLSGIQGG